jgi:hypothetical protein
VHGIEQLERRWLLAGGPVVLSINRSVPSDANTSSESVAFLVTFSEAVTGVDATDFQVVTAGGATASPTVAVSQVSGAVYRVGVFGISGNGTVGLNLVDNGSIRDSSNLRMGANSGNFAAQQTFAAGTYPRTVVTADVNGDGKADIVAADGVGRAVVLLGNGDGTFAPAQTFAVGTGAYSVAVADVNGDGKADILVSNSGASDFSVLLGNGNGTFGPQSTFATDVVPNSLFVADVNGDGKLDVLTANYTANDASVLLGNGNGTFQNQKTFATGGLPFAITAADVNGDGKKDLITANRGGGGSLSVLLGNGDGTFKAQSTVVSGSSPSSIVVADVTGDGKADLVAADANGTGAVDVFLGNGSGQFGPPTSFATDGFPQSVIVADLNGDGAPDLVAVNPYSNTISVLMNTAGTFGGQATFAVGAHASGVAVADFNGDSVPDIVTANQAGGSVSVLLASANGNFTGQVYNVNSPAPLTVTLGGTTPAAVVSGAKSVFSQTVTVTNTGVDPINETVIEGLYLTAPGGVFDASAIGLQSGSKVLRIKPGGHVSFKVRVTSIPAGVTAGDYGLALNLNESGNVTVSGAAAQTISVEAPRISFGTSSLGTPAAAKAGKPLAAVLKVNNGGNVQATGALPMAVYASVDGLMSDAQLLGNVSKKINLKPGASAKVALRGVNAPSTAGSYFLIVRVDADGTFKGDTDQGVIVVSPTAVTVS